MVKTTFVIVDCTERTMILNTTLVLYPTKRFEIFLFISRPVLGHDKENMTGRKSFSLKIKRYRLMPFYRYTHKTSGFKTSGFKTSGFKTSETSGLKNIRFTKRQVYKMSGLQNVRSSKRPVAKKHPYKYSVLVVGGNPQVLLQACLQAK
jgi:hypothetical protein